MAIERALTIMRKHSLLRGAGQTGLTAAIIVVAVILASCGFQLRGQAAIPYKTLFIETSGYSQFANDLERGIRFGSETKRVTSRDEAQAILRLLGEVQETHILSLS